MTKEINKDADESTTTSKPDRTKDDNRTSTARGPVSSYLATHFKGYTMMYDTRTRELSDLLGREKHGVL